jgi:hypothetical protein
MNQLMPFLKRKHWASEVEAQWLKVTILLEPMINHDYAHGLQVSYLLEARGLK